MDFFTGLQIGVPTAFEPMNLLYCFIGVLIGTLIGVLPGIGTSGAVAILMPATFTMSPVSAIIMLAGIYYGAMYGGSTTSILVNIPGEAASVVTCFDGYQLARQGKAGRALGISAFGSFIAGLFGVAMIALLAPSLARLAFDFGPPEFFGLMVLGLTLSTFLGSGSMIKALLMVGLGLVLGCVGTDPISGTPRLTYGIKSLLDGFDMVPVVMGLFGISEVLFNLEQKEQRDIYETKIKGLLPNREDWKRSWAPITRGSILGFFVGVIPGGTAVISSFVSYAVEKRLSTHPEGFGKGAIEGVAGPESANNAATFGSMVPLLTLGIPSNVVMALFLAGLSGVTKVSEVNRQGGSGQFAKMHGGLDSGRYERRLRLLRTRAMQSISILILGSITDTVVRAGGSSSKNSLKTSLSAGKSFTSARKTPSRTASRSELPAETTIRRYLARIAKNRVDLMIERCGQLYAQRETSPGAEMEFRRAYNQLLRMMEGLTTSGTINESSFANKTAMGQLSTDIANHIDPYAVPKGYK